MGKEVNWEISGQGFLALKEHIPENTVPFSSNEYCA